MPDTPFSVSVRVVSNRLPQAASGLHAAVVEQVKRSTLDGEARAKQLAPVRTGTLRRSIHSVFERGGLMGIFGSSVLYAKPVEYGARGRAARPFIRPAAAYVLPRFAEQLRRLLAGLRS